jgi:hypothetical protein
MTDGQMDVERDLPVHLDPLPFGDRQPPGGRPPAPPEAGQKPGALRTLIGIPMRRREVRMLSRPFREMGIAVRRG